MNDSLPQLPEHDPRSDLWARIEADLDHYDRQPTQSSSQNGLDLPSFEPRSDLWDAIEQELYSLPVRPLISTSSWLWTGLTAAAVVVMVGIWLRLHPDAKEQVRVVYTVEHTPGPLPTEPLPMVNQPSIDKRAEEFIAQQCIQQQAACQRPEVHELRNQLVQLSTQQQRILRERRTFGNDPALIRAQVKVENQRAQTLKELITILRS